MGSATERFARQQFAASARDRPLTMPQRRRLLHVDSSRDETLPRLRRRSPTLMLQAHLQCLNRPQWSPLPGNPAHELSAEIHPWSRFPSHNARPNALATPIPRLGPVMVELKACRVPGGPSEDAASLDLPDSLKPSRSRMMPIRTMVICLMNRQREDSPSEDALLDLLTSNLRRSLSRMMIWRRTSRRTTFDIYVLT